ncbi:TATA element modulatory factor isoform X1 [Bombyx mori]|uniref:TATA element modulatory factor 1 TATA binding domain-containing protein n=1 Tax=Bombyx mori TaxID=7091 RepID=A0A8R1WI08_BOMMO|nr:TATA element modulatory factor isoform X1 [Bombyx mori]
MNWFDTSGITSLAKTALKGAQKTIDKALDIQDDSENEEDQPSPTNNESERSSGKTQSLQNEGDFFTSWGLGMSASNEETINIQPVVTESPSKLNSQSLWGSFAGSFFETQTKGDSAVTIIKPPKAKSLNIIPDTKFGSQDDLFSKSQLVMSDTDGVETKPKPEEPKVEDRRGSSRSNALSFMSSRNESSDSVEVLSHSLKTTPDSEASGQSMSSSSTGQKQNSESVEILLDSLMSPSSIECLGFDSYSSDKNSSLSSNPSPDVNDKKSALGDVTEKPETADSVSLVADDDEDTISYNSISECTAPTVLDTDDKPISPFQKKDTRKLVEKEFLNVDHVTLQKIQVCENSSNDGSCSDRTLNADNDSINLENIEESKKDDHDDVLIEKLSDSSSFYNVNVTSDMTRSGSFINIEQQNCSASQSSSSQKDVSMKERTSPVSSDSKSDLVKVGSDRTSGHTSGDDLETTTSSDIEIIPSPNGDGNSFRNSPAKYGLKPFKFDGSISPNLVDLVLGKSLATKIRGHNRELSEASVQSNNSDDSQNSENERLMRRLCEMTEILEARENRLMEVSRNNAELAESNADLKTQVESLIAKHEGGDINSITEEYTQRMSALEKKFQQAIREKDQLRKQLDNLKSECISRKNSSEFENIIKEKDDVIAQLQEEGEKLSKQQLQHSNIIKKLRVKEKDNEQVIKALRDKIAEQTAEIDRIKRAMAAKEELEVSQIEAVYRLTTNNKKLEIELDETKSALDDTTQRLESTRTSLDAARRELNDLQRNSAELQRRRTLQTKLEDERNMLQGECERLRDEVQRLRIEMVNEEKRWVSREESLRVEVREAREAALEAGGQGPVGGQGAAGAVLEQLAQLQRAALERDNTHLNAIRAKDKQIAELERRVAKAEERERLSRDECAVRDSRLRDLDSRCAYLQGLLDSKSGEVETLKTEHEAQVSELKSHLASVESALQQAREALQHQQAQYEALQGQQQPEPEPPSRGDVSPASASDSLSSSLWQAEEGRSTPPGGAALCLQQVLSELSRRDAELQSRREQQRGLLAQRAALQQRVAVLQHALDDLQSLQEQYDALLQMYGEKEEELAELRLDLQDVTALYKQQLDELVALKQALAKR